MCVCMCACVCVFAMCVFVLVRVCVLARGERGETGRGMGSRDKSRGRKSRGCRGGQERREDIDTFGSGLDLSGILGSFGNRYEQVCS